MLATFASVGAIGILVALLCLSGMMCLVFRAVRMPQALAWTRKLFGSLALAACGVGVLVTLVVFFRLPALFDPQGGNNGSCFDDALGQISNGSGMIVSGHYTLCDDYFHSSGVYLYLHGSAEPDRRENLILRYSNDCCGGARPKIAWHGAGALTIAIGNVDQVTKLVPSLRGVHIDYAVGSEAVPRSAWPDHIHHIQVLAVGLVALDIALIFLSRAILRSVRRWATK